MQPAAFSADGRRAAAPIGKLHTDRSIKDSLWTSDGLEDDGPYSSLQLAYSLAGRLAYMGLRDEGAVVYIEGQKRREFEEVSSGGAVFSPDGRDFAYWARDSKGTRLVFSDKEFNAPGKAADLAWFPDGKRVAFVAAKRRHIEIFDKATGTFDQRGRRYAPVFAPAVDPVAGRLAFWGQKDGRCMLVIGEKELGPFDPCDEQLRPPVFSPDGRRVAYAFSQDGGYRVAVDGQMDRYAWQEISSLMFSPDGKRLAYVGRSADRQSLVVDGAIQPGVSDSPIKVAFSPDGAQVAYTGSRAFLDGWVLIDGRVAAAYTYPLPMISELRFGPEGRSLSVGAVFATPEPPTRYSAQWRTVRWSTPAAMPGIKEHLARDAAKNVEACRKLPEEGHSCERWGHALDPEEEEKLEAACLGEDAVACWVVALKRSVQKRNADAKRLAGRACKKGIQEACSWAEMPDEEPRGPACVFEGEPVLDITAASVKRVLKNGMTAGMFEQAVELTDGRRVEYHNAGGEEGLSFAGNRFSAPPAAGELLARASELLATAPTASSGQPLVKHWTRLIEAAKRSGLAPGPEPNEFYLPTPADDSCYAMLRLEDDTISLILAEAH